MLGRVVVLLACCLAAQSAAAADDLWEWVTPRPQGHSLSGATIGNGVSVAVGEKGTVITSIDGVVWRTSHTGADYWLIDVVWANGLFVAVGGEQGFEGWPEYGVVLTSEDGLNWVERVRISGLALVEVAWIGSRFVVVGVGDGVLLSPDGISWSKQDFVPPDFNAMIGLAWNGSLLVAIGFDDSLWPPSPLVYFTSEDGELWRQFAFEGDFRPSSIAALGSRFVVVGGGPGKSVRVSDDGLTWTEVPYDSPREFERIVAGGDRFLAMGTGVVGTSLGGYVWSIEEQPTDGVYRVEWLGDGYLAVGEDGFMMSSPEGSEWTQHSTNSFDLGGTLEINELAKGGSMIVGVGEVGVIITSRHGTEWVQCSSPAESELNSVIWTGSTFWTAGSDGVLRSIDGVRWVQMLLDYDLRLFDIVWNGSLFVAVGRHSTFVDSVVETRHIILMSPDGHDWSSQFFDLDGNLFTVGWTDSQFVAAGSGTYYLTSTDGVVWIQHAQAEDLTLTDMAWNGDRLVAVGGRWGVGGLIRSTADGFNWVESALPEDDVSSFDDVTWTGTHFVAVSRSSGDVVFTSPDGLSWSSETTGTGVWPVSVVGDDRSLFVTGRGLQIIRRTEPLAENEAPRRPGGRVSPVGGKVRVAAPIQR